MPGGGGPGLPYTGSVGATAPTYSMANFFKMTFARGSLLSVIQTIKEKVYHCLRFGGDMTNTDTVKYNYGECEICDTPMQERRISQDFWWRGELIIVKDVPVGVCPQCGEKVVRADVGRWLAKLMENPERIASAPKVSVPAIRFNAEEAAA